MTFPAATLTSGNSGGNVTSYVINLPDNLAVDDIILIAVCKDGTGAVTWPASPAWVNMAAPASDSHVVSLRHRRIDGTEGWDDTGNSITVTGASEGYCHALARITGAHTSSSPFNPTAVVNSAGSTTPDCPAANPGTWDVEDTLWFAIYGWDGNVSHSAYPANYTVDQVTDRWANTGGSGVAMSTRENAIASEDPGTATLSGSEEWCALTVAVRPAPAAQNLEVGFLDNTESLFVPTVESQTALNLSVGFHDETESLFSPTFVKDLELSLLDNTEQLFAPDFVKDLEIGFLDNTESLFTPTLENAGGGEQNLEIPFHQQSTGFFLPSISNQSPLDLEVSHLDNTESLFVPTLETQTPQSVSPARIESTAQLFAPTFSLDQTINPAFIDPTTQLFVPTVENQSPLSVATGFIAAGSQLFVPTIESQPALNFSVDFISFPTTFYQPSLQNEGGDLFEPILAGNGSLADQIFQGLITQGFLTGTISDRERARLLARLILLEPQNLSMMDLYGLNSESNRLYEIGIDTL